MKMRPFVVAAVVALTPLAAAAQDPPAGQQPPDRPGREQAAPEPRPYERVITKDAKSKEGVIITHRIKDKLYYEIPRAAIGREFLWVSQIARTTLGEGYGGQAAGNRVVRWERHDNRVLLRSISYDIVSDEDLETPAPDQVEQQAADSDELTRALEQLPEGQRVVVILKDVYGLSCREIAEEIGIEEGAVKVRLHRARKRLRETLDEGDRRAGSL